MKHYGLYMGSQEVTWKQLPGDPVTIVLKNIPRSPRGERVDTTIIGRIEPLKEAGQMARLG
jgi:hypothetical protein